MMPRIPTALLFCIPVLLSGCYDREREERLNTRERNLLVKEKQFSLKEVEYQALLRMRDSLQTLRDTLVPISVWPDSLAGQWNGKIVCVDSNCPDYVVGDQRNDTWIFANDSTQLVTKVLNNNALVRVYTSTFNGNQVQLHFNTDSSAAKQVEMKVLLNELSGSKIKGTRTIVIDSRCTARFNVELIRATSKDLKR